MVILDTNIIIDHLRQPPEKDTQLKRIVRENPKEQLAISVISIQELYEGKSTKDKEAEKLLLATITPLKTLPYTYDIAQLAGKLTRDSKKTIQFADTAIAATAIINSGQLFTLNKRHFQGIKGLELLDLARN